MQPDLTIQQREYQEAQANLEALQVQNVPEENQLVEETREDVNETLTDPEARKEDESEGKESSPHDKDEEQSAESVESKEKTELEKKLFDVISTFVPHQTDSGMKNMLVGKAIEQLGDLNSDQKMEMVNVLEEYLKQRVHEAEKLINVDAETAVRLAKEISANKKEFVLRKLEAEIKASKQKIEDLEEDISTQEKQLKDYGVSQKGGGSPDVLKRRKEIEGKIESLRTERQTEKNRIRSLENETVAVNQISGNLDKTKGKVRPETLLIYIHYFFLEKNMISAEKKNANEIESEQEIIKKQETLYRQAMELANKDMSDHQIKSSKKIRGLEIAGISKIKLKTLVDFVAQGEILEYFPEAKREKAKEILTQLKFINPDTEQGKKSLQRFINHMATLLPKENLENDLQKVTVQIIATMEGSTDREKWRSGIDNTNTRKIIKLTSGVRRAYESRLAANEEGDFKDLMTKVESFNLAVQEAKQTASPDLPKELREYFNNNFWLYRAARFMGAKGWLGIKKGTPTIAKAGAWSAKKGYETVKKHPWGTAKAGVAGLSVATGYFPAAITAYALWKGGKALINWRRKKKGIIPELP